LIELLIVIAIILILIAIALPNFLQAQTRAKVAKARAEIRTLVTAVESYGTEFRKYPVTRHDHDQVMHMSGTMRMPFAPTGLTSPIPYLEDLPLDVFKPVIMGDHKHSFLYANSGNTPAMQMREFEVRVDGYAKRAHSGPEYGLLSTGPDNAYGSMQMEMEPGPPPKYMMMFSSTAVQAQYAPTNGSDSGGDIVVFGP
jgi:hypothetical protein